MVDKGYNLPNLEDMRKLQNDVGKFNDMVEQIKGLPDVVDKIQKESKEKIKKAIATLSEEQKKMILDLNFYDFINLQIEIRKDNPQ